MIFQPTTSYWTELNDKMKQFNPLNAELNAICHLLALLGAHHILHVSRVRVNVVGIFMGEGTILEY